jgi:hypothetical protein
MYSDFSISKLLRELDGGEPITRVPGSPTEAHMREVLEGYVARLGVSNADEFAAFSEKYLALPRGGQDPVGSKPFRFEEGKTDFFTETADIYDVPFIPIKGEMTAPPTFSMANQAAMSFRLWAEVDGRYLTIDIIEVMTFSQEGKIIEQMAYWGASNVTFLE